MNTQMQASHPLITDQRGAMKFGYARVSTDDQKLDLQLDALTKAGCNAIFKDEGVSGAKTERPGLTAMLQNAQPGDTIIVWKLDRLGRSLMHLAKLAERFEREGIQLRSLSDAIDTSTSGGKFYFHMMCALAQFERDLISERTREGMKAARARGVRLGRPVSIRTFASR